MPLRRHDLCLYWFWPGCERHITTPELAIEWVGKTKKKERMELNFLGPAPEIMEAAIPENKKLG